MKNTHRILSILCVIAMLFALIPAAYSEGNEVLPEAATTEETVHPEEIPDESPSVPEEKQLAEESTEEPAGEQAKEPAEETAEEMIDELIGELFVEPIVELEKLIEEPIEEQEKLIEEPVAELEKLIEEPIAELERPIEEPIEELFDELIGETESTESAAEEVVTVTEPACEEPANEEENLEPAETPEEDETADVTPAEEGGTEEQETEPEEISTPVIPEIVVGGNGSVELTLSPEKQKVYIIARKSDGIIRLTMNDVPGLTVLLGNFELEKAETDDSQTATYLISVKEGKNEIFILAGSETTIRIKAEKYEAEPEEPAEEAETTEEAPVRTVKLISSLDGLTEIEEGTEIVMTVDMTGFTEDEIESVTWQYRPADETEFHDIEDEHGLTYTYPVSAENIYYEWRIVLTMKP